MITTPDTPFPAPNSISATPAASASLSTVTGAPIASLNSFPASVPIHDWSTLAAVHATPFFITAGNVAPVASFQLKKLATSATTAATAGGVAGWGVRIRCRSASS